MFFSEGEIAAHNERFKDMLREAERERLIRIATPKGSRNWKPNRKITGWLGSKMVAWSLKLQTQPQMSQTCCTRNC